MTSTPTNDSAAEAQGRETAFSDPRWVLVAVGLGALALGLAAFSPVSTPDLFGHLAAGRQIMELGRVPQLDTFSFWKDSPQPWANYEWASALVLWWVYQAGGHGALVGLKVLLAGAAGAIVVWRAAESRWRLAPIFTALLLIAAVPALRFRLTVRPHLFEFILAGLLLVVLNRLLREGERATSPRAAWGTIAAIAFSHLLWVNLHGSHLFGLTLTGAHLLVALGDKKARTRIGALLALQLGVSCISPYGPSILFDAIEHVREPAYRQLVSDWVPWSTELPLSYILTPVLATLLFALVAIPLWRDRRAGRAGVVLCAMFLVMAFRSVRFNAELVLFGAPFVAIALGRVFDSLPALKLRRGFAVAFLAATIWSPIAAAAVGAPGPFRSGVDLSRQPDACARWLATHRPEARVFAAIDDAWYVVFGAPRSKVLIDGRVPFYGVEHLSVVHTAFAKEELWLALLERFRVDAVVLRHTVFGQQRVLTLMQALPGWKVAMIEDRHVLFVRDGADPAAAAPRFTHLAPYYAPGALLDPGLNRPAMEQELALLEGEVQARGFVAWTRAMISMRSLVRGDARGGFRAPVTPADKAALEAALTQLRVAAEVVDAVPTIQAHLGLALALACRLDAAEEVLKRAAMETDSRETLLLQQELDLRRGNLDSVARFLSQARAMPEGADDPWLEALGLQLKSPPRCD